MKNLENKRILLIISGGVAAYKALELIRLIKKRNGAVRCILTQGGSQFITPLSVSSISGEETYTDLWSLKDETEMGHIRLSRESDLIVVAPASANMIAKLAWGLADDLAAATLLAANKPILIAPAMNHKMWDNPATKDNIAKLKQRGILQVGPNAGDMACNETGMGRMAEPEEILAVIEKTLKSSLSPVGRGRSNAVRPGEGQKKRNSLYLKETMADEVFAPHPHPLPTGERGLKGLTALVTAGPTYEPIDPVRFIGNHSSGKQGFAIAEALAAAGVKVTLITGPTSLTEEGSLSPFGLDYVKLIHVTTAAEMLRACEKALPADIAIFAAAVSDWTPAAPQNRKIKKTGKTPAIKLKENPDILKTIAAHKKRPKLVIGFAAETENVLKNAKEKLIRKRCDWILANNVSKDVFGADENHVWLVTRNGAEEWKRQSKKDIAQKLVAQIATHFAKRKSCPEAAE